MGAQFIIAAGENELERRHLRIFGLSSWLPKMADIMLAAEPKAMVALSPRDEDSGGDHAPFGTIFGMDMSDDDED